MNTEFSIVMLINGVRYATRAPKLPGTSHEEFALAVAATLQQMNRTYFEKTGKKLFQ